MQYLGHTYTKTLFTAYLRFAFNGVSCISTDKPPGLEQDSPAPLILGTAMPFALASGGQAHVTTYQL